MEKGTEEGEVGEGEKRRWRGLRERSEGSERGATIGKRAEEKAVKGEGRGEGESRRRG